MVCIDVDHPELFDFIRWKTREEHKAVALIAAGFSAELEGEAYRTVSGQNSNNSVRVTDAFMAAVKDDGPWSMRAVTSGAVVRTVKARAIWDAIAGAAWACGDPGIQFDTTINRWHTCPRPAGSRRRCRTAADR